MKIPQSAEIPKQKLSDYLLKERKIDDKSKFLRQAGFTESDSEALEQSLKNHISDFDAVSDSENEYGEFYTVKGDLRGPNGNILKIISVWLKRKVDQIFQFITLKPWKK